MRIVAAGGADITITSPLQAAGADALTNSTSGIPTYDLLSGFNGATWDRLRALGDDSDGVASASLGRLLALARLSGYNGASWDRLLSEGNDRDAIANTTLGNLQTLGFPHGYNGATWDRVRTLGGTSLDGLGQLSVSPAVPGASACTAVLQDTTPSNTTRLTAATPTSGKRIRVISIEGSWRSTSEMRLEFYFGTGANITTDETKAIADVVLDQDTNVYYFDAWPDGGGPVGAVDEVLSVRNGVSVAENARALVHYREE